MARGDRRYVAIIGSANPERNRTDKYRYDPPLQHDDVVLTACEQLGSELARHGCGIVVYASGNTKTDIVDEGGGGFIEPAVVRGYLAAGDPPERSIRVLYGTGFGRPMFDEEREHDGAFDFDGDFSGQWEPSFYRSLADIDAALIVGGGPSARTAGFVCLGRKIPLLAVKTFGAAASKVFDDMDNADTPLTRDELSVLNEDEWSQQSAKRIVDSIDVQQERLDAERIEVQRARESRRQDSKSLLALGLFICAILLIPTALIVNDPNTWPELVLLFVAPLLAGASGGTIRTLLPKTSSEQVGTQRAAYLGAVAGGITGLFYLISQLSSSAITNLTALTPREYHTFAVFSVALGFTAGLALDTVFQRLIDAGVASADEP